jgi:beta-glucanase (GH16 family)
MTSTSRAVRNNNRFSLFHTLALTHRHLLGMLTSWNKICFTTGYVEVSVSLPGSSDTAGLWPGAWTLGNLVSDSYP